MKPNEPQNPVATVPRQLPPEGFLRLKSIIGDTRHPHLLPIIPVGKTKWYDGIKTGAFPPSIEIEGVKMWRVTDIRRLIEDPRASNERIWAKAKQVAE